MDWQGSNGKGMQKLSRPVNHQLGSRLFYGVE